MKAERIVLDTNALLMSISDKGKYNDIWTAFLQEKYILCISNEILEEYVEILSRNINEKVGSAIVYILLSKPNVIKPDPHFHFNIIQADPDDNKFVDCAIASGARLIVTQDHHFNILKNVRFPKVEVVDVDNFLSYIRS